jgi:predicted nucleic acid-binding protein
VTVADAAVLDASVFVRSILQSDGEGARWIAAVNERTVQGHTAVLAFTEIANALVGYVRAGALSLTDATSALATFAALPLRLYGPELAPAAVAAALDLGLSAYDGTYAALAESLDAPLVTADRRLAAAFARSELVE